MIRGKNLCATYTVSTPDMTAVFVCSVLKETGITEYLTCIFRNLYAGQEQQLELDMEQQTGSN